MKRLLFAEKFGLFNGKCIRMLKIPKPTDIFDPPNNVGKRVTNLPCWKVLLKELGHVYIYIHIYFHFRMLSLYLQVAKHSSRSNLEMPPCEDVFTIEQIPNCPLQIIALLNCAKVF